MKNSPPRSPSLCKSEGEEYGARFSQYPPSLRDTSLQKGGVTAVEDEMIIFLRYYFRTNDVEEKEIYDIMKPESFDSLIEK